MTGVADVDVNREEDALAVVGRDSESLGETRLQAAHSDLGHLIGAHALIGHPCQSLWSRPVAPQPNLQEAIPAQGPGLDEPTHGLPVSPQRPELDVACVGMSVKVQHRNPARAKDIGRSPRIGIRNRVVAAEDHGNGAGTAYLLDRSLQGTERAFDVPWGHFDIARIEHPQVLERVDPQGERWPRPVMTQIVRGPDCLRTKTRAGTMRRAAIEGRAENYDVRAGIRARVGQVAARHPEEGDVGTELSAVAGHRGDLGSRVVGGVVARR